MCIKRLRLSGGAINRVHRQLTEVVKPLSVVSQLDFQIIATDAQRNGALYELNVSVQNFKTIHGKVDNSGQCRLIAWFSCDLWGGEICLPVGGHDDIRGRMP